MIHYTRRTFLKGLGAAGGTLAMAPEAIGAEAAPAPKPQEGKPAMNIYIHTDLEGVSAINSMDMIDKAGPRYRQCCEHLMADLNAAVDGAFAGGATHVTVLDSHGGGGNFILDLLDKRAENDTRPNKKWWGIMDDSYQGTFFIGAHAMAGTQNAFLDHTQSSLSWHDYSINGRKMGELAQWAVVAGNWGVPLLMMSGDEAACAEARRFFNPVEAAAVKRGIGRNRAELVDPKEARERIREAARRAMALVGKAKALTPTKPMEIILEYNRADYCDGVAGKEGIERLDARTIRWVTSDPLAILP
ncbi:MAG: M55 family metallopeptidase [Planctomycetota bacterium]|nr:M55 family metallopeptidase [Planctomycetota bacterium]